MSNINEALTAIVKEKKRLRQITQSELANRVGCTQGFMSGMLKGDKPIKASMLEKICVVLGVKLSDLEQWNPELAKLRFARQSSAGHPESPELSKAHTKLDQLYHASRPAFDGVMNTIDVWLKASKPAAPVSDAASSSPTVAPVIEEPAAVPLPPMEEEAREAEDEYEEEDLLRVRYFEDIAAGVPYSVEPPLNLYIDVPRSKLPGGRVKDSWYALRVTGDSMEPKLHSGDIVLMDSNLEPMNGKIVAALIDDEDNTLKVFKYKSGEVTLVPFNPAYAPTTYRADRITVQGVLVDVVRRVGAKR